MLNLKNIPFHFKNHFNLNIKGRLFKSFYIFVQNITYNKAEKIILMYYYQLYRTE